MKRSSGFVFAPSVNSDAELHEAFELDDPERVDLGCGPLWLPHPR